jgi:hypothetical protein
MKDIYVFLHVCSLKRYKEIFKEMWEKSLPLYNECTKFYISVVGPGRMEDVIPNNCDKIELIHHSDDPESHEFPTLHLIQNVCKEKDVYVCYYHLRGVTSPLDNMCVVDQRHYMTHFNIERYKDCIYALESGADAAGVDYNYWPTFHFSGNFWWTQSSHITTLTAPEEMPGIQNFYNETDKKHRHRCEMWICSNRQHQYAELWNSGIHPSQKGFVRYPTENYIKRI